MGQIKNIKLHIVTDIKVQRLKSLFIMDTVKNILMAIPFIKKPVDYFSSMETQMDYEGQRKAEKTYQIIITVFGIVGFIWGFFIQQLSATVYFVLGGFALSCAIVLPPWPFFRRNPLPWQPIETKKAPKMATKSPKRRSEVVNLNLLWCSLVVIRWMNS